MRRLGGSAWSLLAAGLVLVVVGVTAGTSLGLFLDTAQVQNSTFSSDTLEPASGLGATGGLSIGLSWTATTDTYPSGHRVYRGVTAGGPYPTMVAEVTPRTNVTANDNPGIGTFFYVVRAYYQGWESANSNQVTCTRVILTYSC